MIAFATDSFNRADEDPMTNWLNEPSGKFIVVSLTARPDTLGSDCLSTYNGGIVWPQDQYSQAKITTSAGTGGTGVACRSLAPLNIGYRLTTSKAASNNVSLNKFAAGGVTDLGAITTTWVDGDVLRLEVTGAGSGTTILRRFQNGVQIGGDVTDTGETLVGGRPGLWYSTTETISIVDDWEGGGEAPGAFTDETNFPKFKLRTPIVGGRVL